MLFYLRHMHARARIKLCLTLGILIFAINIQAEESFSLPMAIEKTLAHNPQLHKFRIKEKVIRAEEKIQSLKPAVLMAAEIEDFAGSGSLDGFNSASISLALSSTIELGGKRASRISVAQNQLNLAQMENQVLSLNILRELNSVYIQALATQEQIKLSRDSLKLFKLLHQKVLKRVNQGAAPEAEALQAEVEVMQEEIKIDGLTHLLERQKSKIASFWGSSQPILNRLAGDFYRTGTVDEFSALLKKLDQSPNMMILLNRERTKEAEFDLVQANNAANLSWELGIKQYQELDEHALVAGLSLPLFSKSRNNRQLRKILAEKSALDMQHKATANELRTLLFDAYSLFQENTSAAARLQNEILPKLKQATALTLNAYERGRYRYSELINVQKSWLLAKQQLINHFTQAHLARTNIETLTGQAL